jgi:hypothetical protein
VYEFEATSRAKDTIDFRENKVPAFPWDHRRGVVQTYIIKGVVWKWEPL